MSTRNRFLGLLGFGVASSLGLGRYVQASPADIFLNSFVANIENGQWHSKWVRENPDEAILWEQFRDEVSAGLQVIPPILSTPYGKSLVAAGEMHMLISSKV